MSKILITYSPTGETLPATVGNVEIKVTEDRKLIVNDSYGNIFNSSTSVAGTNGTSGSSGSSGQSGISAGQTYYFNNSQSSDISPYKVIGLIPSGAAQQTIVKSLTGSQQGVLVQEFITPQLGFAVIPGGTQRFHFHFLKQASNDQIEAYATIQLANATGGTIGSVISSGKSTITWVDASTPAELTTDITLPTTTIDPTNRMIVRIYLDNNESSAKNITWYTEGTSYYSFVLTSVGTSYATSGTSGMSGSPGVSGSSGTSGTNGSSGSVYNGTSTTSNTIGAGSKTFTTQTNLNYQVGAYLVITPAAGGGNYMAGNITAYNSSTGSLTINSVESGGFGTYTDWIINISGRRGAIGVTGTSGTSGTRGSSGSSGQTGTSGISGTAGTSGVTGQSGTAGTSGVSGASFTVVNDVTLPYTGFTYNTGTTVYEYTLTNGTITASSVVDYVPYNNSINNVIDMELLPYMAVSSSAVKFSCKIVPTADVFGQLIIFN